MTNFVGLDVSQKMTAICVVDNAGHRLWRGQCPTVPEQLAALVRRHAGDEARIGIETGAMTPSKGRTFIGCGRFRKRKVMIIEWPCQVAGGLAAPAGVPVKKPLIARR